MTRAQTSRRRSSAPPATKPANRSRVIIPLVTAATVLFLLIAVFVSKSNESDNPATKAGVLETRPVTVTGKPLADLPESGTDPAIGQPAPELSGAAFDGSPVSIKADGKPKVLLFLNHSCSHCQKEVPVLQRRIDAGLPADVAVYSVSTGTRKDRPNYPPSAWLARERWTLPVLADDEASAAATAFGLSGTPFYVVIDANGVVVQRLAGAIGVERFDALLAAARQTR